MEFDAAINTCKIKQNALQLLFDENLEYKIITKLKFKKILLPKCNLTEPECIIADAVELWFKLYENQENILHKKSMENTLKNRCQFIGT